MSIRTAIIDAESLSNGSLEKSCIVDLDFSTGSNGSWRRAVRAEQAGAKAYGGGWCHKIAAGPMKLDGQTAHWEYPSAHTKVWKKGDQRLYLNYSEHPLFTLLPMSGTFHNDRVRVGESGPGWYRDLSTLKGTLLGKGMRWSAYSTDSDPSKVWLGGAVKVGGMSVIKGREAILGTLINLEKKSGFHFCASTDRTGIGLGGSLGASVVIATGTSKASEFLGFSDSNWFDMTIGLGVPVSKWLKAGRKAGTWAKLSNLAVKIGRNVSRNKEAIARTVEASLKIADKKKSAERFANLSQLVTSDVGSMKNTVSGFTGFIDTDSKAFTFLDAGGPSLEVSLFCSEMRVVWVQPF